MAQILRHSKYLQLSLLISCFLLLYFLVPHNESNWFWRFPSLLAEVPNKVADAANYLLFDWFPIQTYNPELEDYEETYLLKEVTRSISVAVLFLITFIREILLGGVKTIVTFTSWDFVGENSWAAIQGLPWSVVAACATLLGYSLGGRWLAAFVAFATAYISIFGQWEPAMETLSFVLVAAPLSVVFGLFFGIWAYKSRFAETILTPLLNVAQTMPHFSFLVPITVMFGLGDHAGAIATIIFATPPMIRLTLLGLREVSPEVREAALMNGCNRWQLLTKVMLPSARHNLLIGVNQVIMQCLAMAVIASFIGAKGLGYNLLLAINGLKIGQALELGICIVLIAVTLDKLSLGWASKQIDYFADQSFLERNKYALGMIAILTGGSLLAFLGSYFFQDKVNYFYLVPHDKGITTESFWQSGVDWIVENWYQPLNAFNVWLITKVLVPMKNAYLGMPMSATFLLAMGIGFIVGGMRTALVVGGFLLFIALTQWWDRALITMYMATFGVVISVLLGSLIGVISAQSNIASKAVLTICDTMQTFPSFIYIVPVIMLFGVTDTSVLIAVIIYATIPMTRYTIEGLRSVPQSLRDAGAMSGVNRWQGLFQIEIPLALPHIMLGINQTVVFALFMVMIGAMIGTEDLGQLILKALSEKNGIGNGLMLGLCVAFIGLAVDAVIQTWAKQKRTELGLA
ncbi:MAG: ABC transporter permease [Hyphomicrobiales bacterium]